MQNFRALFAAIFSGLVPLLTQATVTQVVVPAPVVADAYESALAELYLELKQPILGEALCEGGQRVTVHADPRLTGRYHVNFGKKRFHMHPVATDTGVLKLEDSAEGVLWLQLGNKSMLMNARIGKRLADNCTNDVQRRLVKLMSERPAEQLFK